MATVNQNAVIDPPAGGVFRIEERRRDGEPGEVFAWTSQEVDPPDLSKGGRGAAPVGRWVAGGQQRHVRTDYPGAIAPTVQVLGPVQKDQDVAGEWDDRFNFAGYAESERERFEEMCRRGSPVWVTFAGWAFDAFITDWDLSYKGAWRVGYKFALTVVNRTDQSNARAGSVTKTKAQTLTVAFQDIDQRTQQAFDENKDVPRRNIGTELSGVLDTALAAVNDFRNAMAGTLDGTESNRAAQAIFQFRRLATQARLIQGAASSVIDELVAVKADAELQTMTAMSLLDFEASTRSLKMQMRLLRGTSQKVGDDMDGRIEPDPFRFYRARQGESLYAISNQFYGAPHSWRLIAERNGLTTLTLQGGEVLMIPERSSA